MCSHELFSLDLSQQMQPRALLAVQITPQETFSRFLYLQLWDFSMMLMEWILMRPDAAKFIIGNAQSRRGPRIAGGGAKPTKNLQACSNDCRAMPGGTPFPKVLGRGRLETSSSVRKLSHGVKDLKGTKNFHLQREMKRVSLPHGTHLLG